VLRDHNKKVNKYKIVSLSSVVVFHHQQKNKNQPKNSKINKSLKDANAVLCDK